MKINFLLLSLILVLSALKIMAQEEGLSKKLSVTIFARDFDASNNLVKHYIDSSKSQMLTYTEGNSSYSYLKNAKITIATDKNGYEMFEKLFDKLGFVNNKNLITTNEKENIEKLKSELSFQQQRKVTYQAELDKMDRNNDKQYSVFWDKIRIIEEQIHNTEQSILYYKNNTMHYEINIHIEEDSGSPQTSSNSKVQFINMPGAEYSYLSIEIPKAGISTRTYQGGAVRYMFTKGKSYLCFGALKSIEKVQNDTLTFTDLFVYNFGQDFYPRYFGRGARKFLNLYTGYHIGGIFATNNKRAKHVFEVTPHVGIELFKNKYLLVDTRIGYLIPISEKFNRNMRGIMGSFAFNFLF